MSTPSTAAAPPRGRLGFVDDLRGLAVILMILWHTVDAWLIPGLKAGPGWRNLVFLGGMAAPLFLFLAGWGAGLRLALADERGEDTTSVAAGIAARGLGILALGYGLRLQMWIIDSMALFHPTAARAWIPMVAGVVLVWWCSLAIRERRWLGVLGVVLYLVGTDQLIRVAPHRYPALLRVDVLQAIGASLIITAGLSRFLRPWRRLLPALVAGGVVMGLTHAARQVVPGAAPEPLAGYLAWWPTPGRQAVAMFPLLPWLSYTIIGSGVGAALGRAHRAGRTKRFVIAIAVIGALLVVFTNETRPFLNPWLQQHPAFVQPIRVLYRIGVALSFGAVLAFTTGRFANTPLRPLGQASLLIYWVHLEFAFGISSRPLKRTLGYGEWALWFPLLVVAMYLLARLRVGPIERKLRERRKAARA